MCGYISIWWVFVWICLLQGVLLDYKKFVDEFDDYVIGCLCGGLIIKIYVLIDQCEVLVWIWLIVGQVGDNL